MPVGWYPLPSWRGPFLLGTRGCPARLPLASSQISTCHQLLHPQVLQLLVKLFETEHSQLDVMEQVRGEGVTEPSWCLGGPHTHADRPACPTGSWS